MLFETTCSCGATSIVIIQYLITLPCTNVQLTEHKCRIKVGQQYKTSKVYDCRI